MARADERERQAAESARYRLGIAQSQAVDVFDAITRSGVRLLRYPLGAKGMLGAYKRLPGEAFIIVNSSDTPVRQRFTAAHELGHHYLGDGGEAEHFDTNESLRARTDRPAQWFAGHFLMDEMGLRSVAEGETPVRAVLKAVTRYEVSVDAAAIQLATIERLTDAEAEAVLADRARYSLLADFFRANGLTPPPTRHPENRVILDAHYEETARRLATIGALDEREVADLLFTAAPGSAADR